MKVSKGEQKKSKLKAVAVKRKPWANTNLILLEKKFDEFLKTLAEPKEEDSAESQLEYIKIVNYLNQVMHHLKEVYAISAVLN